MLKKKLITNKFLHFKNGVIYVFLFHFYNNI